MALRHGYLDLRAEGAGVGVVDAADFPFVFVAGGEALEEIFGRAVGAVVEFEVARALGLTPDLVAEGAGGAGP